MTDTKTEPQSKEEQVLLTLIRESGLGFEKTCELVSNAMRQGEPAEPDDEAEDVEEAEPDAPPVKFDWTYAEARELAVSICRKAAADWHEAEARLAKGRERAAHMKRVTEGCTDDTTELEAEEWARWLDALATGRNDAERRLIGCILMSFRRIDRVDEIDEQGPGWKPVAFELDGPHYVVAPRDEDDPRPGRPYLFVVDGADFDSQDYGASGGMPDFYSGKHVGE